MDSKETEVAPSLTLNEYQEKCRTTAIYPDNCKVVYPALGLVDEIGELLSADLADPDNFIAEAGDVMWYCAILADDLGVPLQVCFENPDLKAIPDGQALFTNAAIICGRVKKILRGDGNEEDRHIKVQIISACIGDIVTRLQSLAGQFEVPLEEVCERNIDKLFDRKERGVLKGDGDNR